jgi:ABC-2 type transport system permease protein
MRGCYATLSKEVANYFVSPIAYVVIVIFLVVAGFFFWANMSFMSLLSLQAAGNPALSQRINVNLVVVRPTLQNMAIILLFLMPLMTMRLFSEEKRSGSIELLLTYPISDIGVMLGKFFAAIFLLIVALLGTVTIPGVIAYLSNPDWGPFITGYLGLLLMSASFLSMGMFISSLTENQIIAAAITFGASILFWVISWTSTFVEGPVGEVIKQLSILEHMESFNKGILSLSDLSFFILFILFFLFLTLRSLEAHRWRG